MEVLVWVKTKFAAIFITGTACLFVAQWIVDDLIAHPRFVFGDVLPIGMATGLIVSVVVVVRSKSLNVLIKLADWIGQPHFLDHEKRAIQVRDRIIVSILMVGVSILSGLISLFSFSEPLNVLAGNDGWFATHWWSWGVLAATVSAFFVASLIPVARTPFINSDWS